MSLVSNLQSIDVNRVVTENQGMFESLRQLILDNFGQNGLYAFYMLVGAIVISVIYFLVKFALHLVMYVILPAILSAFVLTFVVPFSFSHLVPATTALFTVGLLFRK